MLIGYEVNSDVFSLHWNKKVPEYDRQYSGTKEMNTYASYLRNNAPKGGKDKFTDRSRPCSGMGIVSS